MARYTRNLASISGDLTSGVFDITVAARAVVDDNYAWEVWQMANRYPAQKAASDLLETVNLSGEEIWLTIASSCCMRPSASVKLAGMTASGGVLMHP